MDKTNVWDFLGTLVTVAVPATVTIVTYLLTRRGQDPKIDANAAGLASVKESVDRTEVLVNGDRAAKEARIQTLESKLRDSGIDPK